MSEIRYDRLYDTHVIIAPERLHRPDFAVIEKQISKVCPFCEEHESMTPKEIFALRSPNTLANQPGWLTRVVPNLYKAVAIEAPHQHHSGNYEYWDGFGAHEVIIDTPKHYVSMMEWNQEEIFAWLKTLRARIEDLRRDHRMVYFSLFKNEGFDAGATMEHSHTQLIALPLIPKTHREFYRRCRDYFQNYHHALMESILLNEEAEQVRMIESQGEFSAFCPYSSAYPFEVMISSKKWVGQIDTLNDHYIEELSILLVSILQRLKKVLNQFSFNLWVSTPPAGENGDDEEAHRLTIRIMPRIYRAGGFEITNDMMINPVKPELAAKLLRGDNHE